MQKEILNDSAKSKENKGKKYMHNYSKKSTMISRSDIA